MIQPLRRGEMTKPLAHIVLCIVDSWRFQLIPGLYSSLDPLRTSPWLLFRLRGKDLSMEDFNILISSAGRRVSLTQSFKDALHSLRLKGKVFTADASNFCAAHLAGDGGIKLPPIKSDCFLPALKDFCLRNNVRLVVPTIDTELLPLALAKENFAENGISLLVSSPEVIRICYDKFRTAQFFESHHIPHPRLYSIEQLQTNSSLFPVFIKPAQGSASVGACPARTLEELEFFRAQLESPLIQEYVKGQEYTLDVLGDFQGTPRCVVPRLRLETRAGEISKGYTVRDADMIVAAQKLVQQLPGVAGPITVQCFKTPSASLLFTEMNPRFGGGIPLTIQAGANYPRWIIEWLIGRDPVISDHLWKENMVMLRYDQAVFTSLDSLHE